MINSVFKMMRIQIGNTTFVISYADIQCIKRRPTAWTVSFISS